MDMSYLPPELLMEIFQYMSGRDIIECGNVCQRWKLVVDGLTDEFWRKMCERDHSDVYKDAHRKARLSWRELWRSLALWSEIATADVTVQKIPDIGVTTMFRIIGNGILACTEDTDPSFERFSSYMSVDYSNNCHLIAYYDLLTLEEINWVNFDFIFSYYDENDEILVVQNNADGFMHIIPKSYRESYIKVCHVKDDRYGEQWALNGNKVYYLTKSNKLRCVKLIEDNNSIAWENVIVADDIQDIWSLKSVVDLNNTQINILTWNGRGQFIIYSLIDGELKEICALDNSLDKIEIVHRHGFQVPDYFLNMPNGGFPFRLLCLYFYGKIAIATISINHDVMDDEYVLRIYYNAFREDGRLDLFNSVPVKSIELPKDYQVLYEKIDVLETRNGHKIVISYSGKLLLFELKHEMSGTDAKYVK